MLAEAEAQRQSLAGLLRRLNAAKPEDLPALRAHIAAASAAGAHLAQQAAPATRPTEQMELDAARDASRQQVRSHLRDMHRFDPYLQFASAEDEEAYRRREAERRAYIEQQHARGTPQGDLNAAGAAVNQMVDAQAHGADRSPEFRQRFDELVDTTAQLRERSRSLGYATTEFDDRLRDGLRDAMRQRGLSEAESEARLALHPGDPLQAVRDHMRNAAAAPHAAISPPVQTVEQAMAEFRAAGIVTAERASGEPPAHGLAANERPAPGPAGRVAGC